MVLGEIKSRLSALADAHAKDAIASGSTDDLEDIEYPIEQFPIIARALDKMIASKMDAQTAIGFLRAKKSKEREGGLAALERMHGLSPAMAEEVFKEVEDYNYLKEAGDDLEDYK